VVDKDRSSGAHTATCARQVLILELEGLHLRLDPHRLLEHLPAALGELGVHTGNARPYASAGLSPKAASTPRSSARRVPRALRSARRSEGVHECTKVCAVSVPSSWRTHRAYLRWLWRGTGRHSPWCSASSRVARAACRAPVANFAKARELSRELLGEEGVAQLAVAGDDGLPRKRGGPAARVRRLRRPGGEVLLHGRGPTPAHTPRVSLWDG